MRAGRELLKFAGIGAGLAVRRVFGRDDGERFLQDTLSGMPGAPAKIGQLLGMRAAADIPTPEPMPLIEVKAIIDRECPQLAAEIDAFSEWSRTASLGQTHQARLRSGELVAIKVQYPEVAESLAAQIDVIFGLAGVSPARKYDFDVGGTRQFMRQKLLEETDYRVEAATQNRFYARYAGSSVIVPRVYPMYSTAKVLTQSWEDCVSLGDATKDDAGALTYGQRCKAGAVFSSFVFDSAFGLGMIHTDLNPANYGFRVDGDETRIVLYDYGSAYAFAPDQGVLFYRWLEATRSRDARRVFAALEAMGFSGSRLRHIESKLPALSEALLKPLLTGGLWNADEWKLQDAMDEILGQDKWWFRTAGPPWFMYFMRTIQGWHHAMSRLGGSVNVAQIWWPWEQQLSAVSTFMAGRDSSSFAVDTSRVSGADAAVVSGPALEAKSLRVLVTEGGEEIVDVTLPARAIEDLEDLIPDNVREKCVEEGIHLTEIKLRAIASGGRPQELFTASHGKRHYKVWLA